MLKWKWRKFISKSSKSLPQAKPTSLRASYRPFSHALLRLVGFPVDSTAWRGSHCSRKSSIVVLITAALKLRLHTGNLLACLTPSDCSNTSRIFLHRHKNPALMWDHFRCQTESSDPGALKVQKQESRRCSIRFWCHKISGAEFLICGKSQSLERERARESVVT